MYFKIAALIAAVFVSMFSVFSVGVPVVLCYPPAGSDTISHTTAIIEIEISGMFYETLEVKGPTIVSRSAPYDPGDGHMKIDTEIVSMSLTGMSSYIGPITIIESPSKPSNGTIQQLSPGVDFPADSFFDVFVEINTMMPPPFSTLHNDDLVRVNATIYSIPPWGSTYISPLEPIPLKNELNEIIGFITNCSHRILIPGDIDGNSKVQLADLVLLAKAYGSHKPPPDDPNWNPDADLDKNDTVGLSDLVILAQHYGQHYP